MINKTENNNTENKQVNIPRIIILMVFLIAVISSVQNKDKENTEISSEPQHFTETSVEELSEKDVFCNDLDNSSEFVNSITAESLYNFLNNELLFESIVFNQKSQVGNILFNINADNYNLIVSVDDDGIYSVKCGGYELYNGQEVLMTKSGLDDRNIGTEKSNYYAIAKEIVKNNLKSPSTAEFPSLWSDEIKMRRNENLIAVQGYVDAQNSFGATIRSQWLVEFKVIDLDSYSYEVIYINIDGTTAGDFIELD